MKIVIYTDNSESWFIPFGLELKDKMDELGHSCLNILDKEKLPPCDILFILSCTKLIPSEFLIKNNHNIVVHASDLPRGKGFSPLQWQILEGKKEITLTLFEAVDKIDAGPYYFKSALKLNGTELLDELRSKMGNLIIKMCLDFVRNIRDFEPIEQMGEESFYRRRIDADDELDIDRSIKEQFNHFRIADNENYPLYFNLDGQKYYLKIYKD